MELATSISLLARLRDTQDGEAWNRFYAMYSPLIAAFARRQGCSEEAVGDVLQETMVSLLRCMPSFSYEPSRGRFRSLLLKIVDNKIADAHRRRSREQAFVAEAEQDVVLVEELHGEAPVADPEQWDRLWRENLLVKALAVARKRVNGVTYRSFELHALKGVPAADVAEQLGITAGAVYQHRNRIIKLLRKEIAHLETECGGEQ